MDSGFRRREIASNEVRLSCLDHDGDGSVCPAIDCPASLTGPGDTRRMTAATSPTNAPRDTSAGNRVLLTILAAARFTGLVARLIVLGGAVAGGARESSLGRTPSPSRGSGTWNRWKTAALSHRLTPT